MDTYDPLSGPDLNHPFPFKGADSGFDPRRFVFRRGRMESGKSGFGHEAARRILVFETRISY